MLIYQVFADQMFADQMFADQMFLGRRGSKQMVNALIDALRNDDVESWRSFVWLGVLLEDAIVAAPMATTLWNIEEEEAATRLERLRNQSLLLSRSPIQIDKRSWPAYCLPQRLHAVARHLLTTPATGLGIPLAQAHAELLDRYRTRRRSNLWHTLADDGYIHAYLTWHLEQADQEDDIHQLLQEELFDADCEGALGRNGWYEACARIGQTATFAEDVSLAWWLAEDLFEETPARAIALQCRYALMESTLTEPSNRVAEHLPATSPQALLTDRKAASAKDLACVLQHLEPEVKANLLMAIGDRLHQTPLARNSQTQNQQREDLQQLLEVLKTIRNEYERFTLLERLASNLPPDLLPEAFAIAKAIRTGFIRVKALKALAPKLPPNLRLEALDIVTAFQGESAGYCRSLGLSAVVNWLPEELRPELLSEALASARSIQTGHFRDSVYCAKALSAVSEVIPEPLRAEVLQEALDTARMIEEDWCRCIALAELAPKLSEELRAKAVEEALAAAVAEAEDWATAKALLRLLSSLPVDLLPGVLTVARNISEVSQQARVLIALAARLPEMVPEVFDLVKNAPHTPTYYTRPYALMIALAPTLTPELLFEAFVITMGFQHESDRINTLIALAARMSQLPTSELYPLWQNMLHRLLPQPPQRNFFPRLLALTEVIYALGDRDTVVEVVATIADMQQQK